MQIRGRFFDPGEERRMMEEGRGNSGSRLSVHGEGLILVNGSCFRVNGSWLGRRKR